MKNICDRTILTAPDGTTTIILYDDLLSFPFDDDMGNADLVIDDINGVIPIDSFAVFSGGTFKTQSGDALSDSLDDFNQLNDTFVFDLTLDDGDDTLLDFERLIDGLSFTVDGPDTGDDVAAINAEISSIVEDMGDGSTIVEFDSGTSVDFDNVAFAGQTGIEDFVDNTALQIIVDYV